MINNIEKESKQLLASSLYNPSIHGSRFRQTVAEEIIEKHIEEIYIDKIPSENNVIVNAKVKGNILATDNRCMDFYNARITSNKDGVYSQDKNTNEIRFRVIQIYKNQDENEIKTNYKFIIKYL